MVWLIEGEKRCVC